MATSIASGITHVYSTVFEFGNEAKDEIQKRFGASAGNQVDCEDEDDFFIIHCPSDDLSSLPKFTDTLQDFITEEEERQLDVFDNRRIRRVRGTCSFEKFPDSQDKITRRPGMGVSDDAALATNAYQSSYGNPNQTHGSDEKPLLIDHETIHQTWSPKLKGGLLGLKLRDQILGRIGALCSCRLDCSESDIAIKSDSQKDIDNAISKLNVLDERTHSRITLPYVFSIPVLEGQLAVTLQMVALKDLQDMRLRTTLVPPKSPLSNNLQSALVVSLIRGSVPVALKPIGSQGKTGGTSLWKEYPHQPFGLQAENDHYIGPTPFSRTIRQPSVETIAKPTGTEAPSQGLSAEKLATPTGQWLQQNPSEFEDPFKSGAIVDQREGSIPERPIVTPAAELARPPTKRARAPRGALKFAMTDSASATTALNQATMATHPTIEPASAATALTQATMVTQPAIEDKTKDSFLGAGPGIIRNQRPCSGQENRQPLIPVPIIEGPYMPPLSLFDAEKGLTSPLNRTEVSNQTQPWHEKTVCGPRDSVLIDIEEKPRKTVAKDVKRTMGQKKPRQQITGSKTEAVKKCEKAAMSVLNLALEQQGPFQFELGIGRLLVNPESSTAEFRKPFALTQWHSVFPVRTGTNESARQTAFMPRLTTLSRDVESILSITLSSGRRLYIEEPRERKVTYVISCLSKMNGQIVIEVCEDGSFVIKGPEFLIGALDWHFPLRSWDSRLKLTAQEPLLLDYQKQVQAIVDSMKVVLPTDEKKSIQFSTTTVDQELVIQSISLQRETTHSVTIYPDLSLCLKEIQDMSVQQAPTSKNTYQGSIQVPSSMISAGKLWWQASITSTNAAVILKESDTLEFGDCGVGKWSPESIIGKGVIEDMYSLVTETVTKIDHIGSHNRGPGSTSNVKTFSGTSLNTSYPGGSSQLTGFW